MFPTRPTVSLGMAYNSYARNCFGIMLPDRLKHFYTIGQTGTGKSTLLANMLYQDIRSSVGCCLVEPHGDLSSEVSHNIAGAHIYWDVADPTSPYGYNPLTRTSPALRPLVTSGLIDTLKQRWADAWGPKMEHLLRYAILALLDQPQANLTDITRLYFDKDFRRIAVSRITDPYVLRFWKQEFPAMGYKNAADGVAPIANKLGAFLAHPIVRKAVCGPKRPLRFRKIMDDGQCLIVNLSKGKLGADTANVIGSMVVSGFLNAAFSRADMPEHQRKPFFLYTDEFSSFSTAAFADVLSETRKYGLGLILSHQYTGQLEHSILEAILGNVGTIMAFRIGALDTPLLCKQLTGVTTSDLVNQPNYHAYTQLMVNGMKTKPFSTFTHPPLIGSTDNMTTICNPSATIN